MSKKPFRAAQYALADRISADSHACAGLLVPTSHPGQFSAVPLFDWPSMWTDKPAHDLVWLAIASRVNDIIRLDHSWSLGFHRKPYEPWGFVTEPYVDPDTFEADVVKIRNLLASWFVQVMPYPPEMSAWNAPHCTPIAITFAEHSWAHTMRSAFRWLADN